MRCEVDVVLLSCVVIRLSDGHRRWRECSASIFRVDSEDELLLPGYTVLEPTRLQCARDTSHTSTMNGKPC